MQIGDLLSMLRRDWLPIILLPIIALGITVAVQPANSYEATDTVQVLPSGGVSSISSGAVAILMPGVVENMQNPSFGDHAAAAANLAPSVVDAPVDVAVAGDPTTGLVTVTATGPRASALAPWAKAYGDYLIQHKAVVDPNNLTTISQVSVTPPSLKPRSTKAELVGAGLAGLVLGLLLSIGIGFYRADRTDPDRIRRRFGTDVVVRMPLVRTPDGLRSDGSVLSDSPAVHELNLRLELSGVVGRNAKDLPAGGRVIAVLSEDRGEGKTEVANGLAWEMTRAGQSVAVVHLDLQPSRPGINPAVRRREQGASGAAGPFHFRLAEDRMHPAEVVLSALPRVVEELSGRYKVVLVDGPPMSAGADAEVVAALAGSVLWVSGPRLDRNQLRRRLTEFAQHGVDLLGLVIDRPPRRFSLNRVHVGPARPSPPPGGQSPPEAGRVPAAEPRAPGRPSPAAPAERPAGSGQARPSAVTRPQPVAPGQQIPAGSRTVSPAKPPDGGLSWG